MFDERRRFDRCVFCAADPAPAALTAEHVFGKWLASRFQERFGALPNWVVAEEDSHGKGGGPILSVAPRLACAHCNNGVLSADMEASQEPLWRAIVGEHHVMTVADQRSIARYWDRVGIIADVMTSDHQLSDAHRQGKDYTRSRQHRWSRPVLTSEERREWTLRKQLRSVSVAIGHHTGVLGVNPQAMNAPLIWVPLAGGEVRIVAKRFLVAIGHLVVCVRIGSDPRPLPSTMAVLPQEAAIGWQPPISVDYSAFYSMANPDQRHDAIVRCLADPALRAEIEAHTRATKRFFEIPSAAHSHVQRVFGVTLPTPTPSPD